MSSRSRGLTRTELTVALAIVAVAASVAVPSALGYRIAANEASAVASLREIADAQEKFKAAVRCDVDQDGVGEYGLLRELTGAVGVRTSSNANSVGNVLDPPLLSSALSNFNVNSEAPRSGYLFKMFLPASGGRGVPEISSGSLPDAVHSNLATTTWCCYATPEQYGQTGRQTFFINQSADIVTTDWTTYSGTGQFVASNAGAAFHLGGAATSITGSVATGTKGRDNILWRPVAVRAGDTDWTVRGRLASMNGSMGRRGTFVLNAHDGTTQTRETIAVHVRGVDPELSPRLVLIDASGTRTADFGGPLRWWEWRWGVDRSIARTRPMFLFNSATTLLPEGVGSVAEFGGGVMEIRAGDTVLLRGRIPPFARWPETWWPGAHTAYSATAWLRPPSPLLPGAGAVAFESTFGRRGMRSRIRLDVEGLDPAFSPYDVDIEGVYDVDQFRTRGRRGSGAIVLDWWGHWSFYDFSDYSGVTIKVRSHDGRVVLEGVLPTIE